jgi:hypothetical protein
VWVAVWTRPVRHVDAYEPLPVVHFGVARVPRLFEGTCTLDTPADQAEHRFSTASTALMTTIT